MLILETAPSAFGVATASPFCRKAEILLAMSGLDHELRPSDPRRGPRGKIPFLHDGDEIIADSRLIQQHLERRYEVDFDPGLRPEDKGVAVAARRLIEEHLYWAQTYFRWEHNGDNVRQAFFGALPLPLSHLVFRLVRRQVRTAMHAQGLGRMTEEEIVMLAGEDLTALNRLFQGPFFFGPKLTSIDASLAGLIENILAPELDTPLHRLAEPFRDYVQRVTRATPVAEVVPSRGPQGPVGVPVGG
ncbi:MAG: glutathione S-transferase family protein [Myxococcota bacterium]